MSQLFSIKKVEKSISAEQIQQIVGAIQERKYSWACVLMLRSAGHNPLQYIPYRTYNRLRKQNEPVTQSDQEEFTSPSRNLMSPRRYC
ncbi:MAG TPA: HetP family heterocyst commitment protein [Oscillatoriaceae cyanobacterium M33_DOE_052]|uniref:Heterocyst formation protein HetP n=1 Tax=Planktothricoides sp. SpSt-374 TaxID=2282167 RepID=A0A7C3VT59_9CYAN|nr:HetP family heterocyst commitment protein [Oscillatoriaceae cyanobacterium M33_DOE_052]